jgi:hypothetical protein
MDEPKPPSDKVLEFAVPEGALEAQLEDWLERVFQSKDELVQALERLRVSYFALRAGKPATDEEEVLDLVNTALQNADKAKSIV